MKYIRLYQKNKSPLESFSWNTLYDITLLENLTLKAFTTKGHVIVFQLLCSQSGEHCPGSQHGSGRRAGQQLVFPISA